MSPSRLLYLPRRVLYRVASVPHRLQYLATAVTCRFRTLSSSPPCRFAEEAEEEDNEDIKVKLHQDLGGQCKLSVSSTWRKVSKHNQAICKRQLSRGIGCGIGRGRDIDTRQYSTSPNSFLPT